MTMAISINPLNPNHINVGDWVFARGNVGYVQDIAVDNGKVLQFWVLWNNAPPAVPENAYLLHKVNKPVGVTTQSYPFIELASLILDPQLQQRVKLDLTVVDDYLDAYSNNTQLPPITVWSVDNEENYYLVDGFHRVEAAKLAGIKQLPYTLKTGSYRDAILFSVTVNATHGLRRNNADKRKAVMTLLNDPEWSQLSTRELAKLAKVSHQLVHKIRLEIADTERRQQNWREIREGNGEQPTGNSEGVNTLNSCNEPSQTNYNKIEAPENTISQTSVRCGITPYHDPDIIPLDQNTYSIICDRSLKIELENLGKSMKIETIKDVIEELIKFYNENVKIS